MMISSHEKNKVRLVLSLGFSYIFKTVLSFSLGIIVAQFQIFDNFSPFMLMLLATSGKIGLIPSICYLGSAIGLLTLPFSSSTFKYITALSMLYILYMIGGKKSKTSTHLLGVWSGIICFTSGILFMLPNQINLFNILLLVSESALICCCNYFIFYSAKAFRKNSRLSGQEIIATMVSLILILVILKNYSIAGLNVAHVVAFILLLMGIHFLKFNHLILFSTIIGMIIGIMNRNGEEIFLGVIFGSVLAAIILRFTNRLIPVSFTLPYFFILFLYGNFPWNYHLFFEPIVSVTATALLPKKKIKSFLGNYIDVRNEFSFLSNYKQTESIIDQCKNGCKRYCSRSRRCYKKNQEQIKDLLINEEKKENIDGDTIKFCIHPNEMLKNVSQIIKQKNITKEKELIDELRSVTKKFETGTLGSDETFKIYYDEEKTITSALISSGFSVKEISITSSSIKNKTILLICDKISCQNPKEAFQNIVSPYFSSPYSIEMIKNNKQITLEAKEYAPYRAECSALSLLKSGETSSGDTACCFSTDTNNFFLLLSDGMGSGKNAELASKSTIDALHNILKSGFSTSGALSIFEAIRELYCPGYFATIDLCHVNFEKNTATFYKIGAYNSYHVNKQTVRVIQGGGLPIGLTKQEPYTPIDITIQHNDFIIMSSDGASFPEDKIICSSIEKENNSAKHIAENLIRAVSSQNISINDDITILVCKIIKNTPSAN